MAGVFTAGIRPPLRFPPLFLCFFGELRGDPQSFIPHGIAASMWIPLAILAALSLGGGYINIPKFLTPMFGEPHEGEPWLMYVSVAMGLGRDPDRLSLLRGAPAIPRPGEGLQRTIPLDLQQVLRDEFYDATVVEPVIDGSRELLWRIARRPHGLMAWSTAPAQLRAPWQLLRRAHPLYRDYAGWWSAGPSLSSPI